MRIQFLNLGTGQPIRADFQSNDFEQVSDVYNSFVAQQISIPGTTASVSFKSEDGAICRTFSNNIELRLYPQNN